MLPEDRTVDSTRDEHVDDHNYLHRFCNEVYERLPVHYATMVNFDTPGVSSPSGAIAGVEVHTPAVGDILFDCWLEVLTEWDGNTPTAEIGYFLNETGGLFDVLGSGAPSVGNGTEAYPNYDYFRAPPMPGYSLQQSTTAYNSYGGRGTFITSNPLKFIVSDNGATDGNDPGATKGICVVHLLIIPAAPAET